MPKSVFLGQKIASFKHLKLSETFNKKYYNFKAKSFSERNSVDKEVECLPAYQEIANLNKSESGFWINWIKKMDFSPIVRQFDLL